MPAAVGGDRPAVGKVFIHEPTRSIKLMIQNLGGGVGDGDCDVFVAVY